MGYQTYSFHRLEVTVGQGGRPSFDDDAPWADLLGEPSLLLDEDGNELIRAGGGDYSANTGADGFSGGGGRGSNSKHGGFGGSNGSDGEDGSGDYIYEGGKGSNITVSFYAEIFQRLELKAGRGGYASGSSFYNVSGKLRTTVTKSFVEIKMSFDSRK